MQISIVDWTVRYDVKTAQINIEATRKSGLTLENTTANEVKAWADDSETLDGSHQRNATTEHDRELDLETTASITVLYIRALQPASHTRSSHWFVPAPNACASSEYRVADFYKKTDPSTTRTKWIPFAREQLSECFWETEFQ